jgi:hypothetical protein
MEAYRAVKQVVAPRVVVARGAGLVVANGGDPSLYGEQELVDFLMKSLRDIQVPNFTNRSINVLFVVS